MLMIDALIEEADTANKTIKKQLLVTKPELSRVSEDLSAIVDNMHASLDEIDRVDQLIFPLLQLEDPYLRVPTIRKNPDAGSDDEDEDEDERLIRYVETIDRLIS